MFKRREGFTLLEVILVIALIGIIIPAIYSIFSTGNTSYGISKNRGFAQQDVRLASDFIASNLKYVTALSDDENEFYTDYYSLKIIQNSDKDVLALIHNVRDDKGTETLEDDTIDQEIIKQISGVWDSILISYTKEDKIISSTVSKTEGSGNTSSRFELPIDTQSINSSNLSTNISVELYDGEAVYFRDAKDVISKKSIYITDSSEAEDEDTVKVNYYSNGTLYRSDFVARGNTITLAGIEDDFFKGWSRNEDLSGVLFTSLTIFEDTNLYAVWEMGDTDPEKVAVVNSVKILHDGNYKGPNEDNDRLNIKKGVDSYSTKFWITGENLQGIDFELRAEGIKADSL
jgi:prepilin-type N-terminal cleavage/methylation domain-containing protein